MSKSSIALYAGIFSWPFLTLWLFYIDKIQYSIILIAVLVLCRLFIAFVKGKSSSTDKNHITNTDAQDNDKNMRQEKEHGYLSEKDSNAYNPQVVGKEFSAAVAAIANTKATVDRTEANKVAQNAATEAATMDKNAANGAVEDSSDDESKIKAKSASHALIYKKSVRFKENYSRMSAIISLIAVVLVGSLYLFVDRETAVFYYPVCLSLCFFTVFFSSLIFKPSVITMIAFLTVKDIDEREIVYTTRLTMIWCVYFLINALIAGLTIYLNNKEMWALYSGGISYVIMGTLFIGERLFRPHLRNLIA